MLTPLWEASRRRCGNKAATLSILLREGLQTPDGFVVPFDEYLRPGALEDAVAHELKRMGDPVVVVRSSATAEDTEGASAAGQYESILGVRGVTAVCEAIAKCRASARSSRVNDYWNRTAVGAADPGIAVLVQPLITADVSGVMFTPGQEGGPTRIEASWGLGPAIVDGIVAPDSYEVAPDTTVLCMLGSKKARVDLGENGVGLTRSFVDEPTRAAHALSNEDAESLAELGSRIEALLGRAQDIEWAIADGETWILQARPVTASVPRSSSVQSSGTGAMLAGVPGSHGVVTAQARIVRSPSDFGRVRRGEIVVCPYTDPAWTPLFSIAAGVIVETGGTLSHAAIVAREYEIPAVLCISEAMQLVRDGDLITLDGTAGTVIPA